MPSEPGSPQKYLILANTGPLNEWVVASTLEGVSLEFAKEKTKQLKMLNESHFERLEVKLFGGEFFPL